VRYFLLPLKRRTTYYLLTRLDLEVVIPELRGDIRTGDRLIMLAAPETLPYQPWATVATVRGRDAEDPNPPGQVGPWVVGIDRHLRGKRPDLKALGASGTPSPRYHFIHGMPFP